VKKYMTFVVAGAALLAVLGGTASAASLAGPDGGGAAAAPLPDRTDDAIKRAFRDVLNRQPSSSELRRYRTLMEEDGWTESDIRRDLKSRQDYRTHSGRGSSSGDIDRIIRRAYQDILDRDPDQEGLRSYRRAMIDKGWTEQDVREDLRKSPEYAKNQRRSAERIVTRAYQEVLGREPDPPGLNTYTNRVMRDGWDEYDVRAALEKSPEYRERNTMTREKAEQIVRSAYKNVLKRDADDVGLRNYIQRVMRDRWTQPQIERELRQSEEYRNMKK
jgi:TorA maturation chaperone TorD